MPGIYSVAMGATTNQFSVNALAADESRFVGCASGQWGKWSEDTERGWKKLPPSGFLACSRWHC
jgi:hypothetical protein